MFANILHSLYCEPWAITPLMHNKMISILEAHLAGTGLNDAALQAFADESDIRRAADYVVGNNGMAVIEVNGVIARHFSLFDRMSGAESTDQLQARFERAQADASVKGVLLVMDSPGGQTTGVPEFAESIRTAEKPVVVYTSGQCCSAAYWLAASADKIVASPSSSVGSIGVFCYLLDESKAFDAAGVKVIMPNTGKYKGMGMPGVPVTQDQVALLEANVGKVFDWFKGAINENRTISDDSMQGQSFYGEEAQTRGLVDQVGDYNDAVALLDKHMADYDELNAFR